jgi:putative membrane protein
MPNPHFIGEEGHKRIVAAIDAIDAKSDGEVYCLIARESSNYREVPLAWAAIAALLVPPLALMFGVDPNALVRMAQGWTAGQATLIQHQVVWALSNYAVGQAALFAIVALVISIPAVRRLVTPPFLKAHRVRQVAAQHFTSTGIHLAPDQPHVLLYLSLAERRVEILADEPIHKIEGQKLWDEARAAIIAGMSGPDPAAGIVQAIEIVGAPLIQHFPATAAHPNVTADGIREL